MRLLLPSAWYSIALGSMGGSRRFWGAGFHQKSGCLRSVSLE